MPHAVQPDQFAIPLIYAPLGGVVVTAGAVIALLRGRTRLAVVLAGLAVALFAYAVVWTIVV